MKVGDNIKILLSCGITEEGIIKDLDFRDSFDSDNYIILSHLISGKELNIKKKYIAAYQNTSLNNKVEKLVIEDISLDTPIRNTKLRIKKLAELAINKGVEQRSTVKKIIENPNANLKGNLIEYALPSFLKK